MLFGEVMEMLVIFEIVIFEVWKEEEKIEGDKCEKVSEVQEFEVGFCFVCMFSEVVVFVIVDCEVIFWLYWDFVYDYFFEFELVFEVEVEKE